MQLNGKVAAVTGGTAGIGRGIAEAYLAEGARVALMARNADKAAAVLAEIGAGEQCIFVPGDATSQADVEGFCDQVANRLGPVDILVNNAGGASDLQPVASLSDEAFDLAMKWNLYATFWACRRVVGGMCERGYGRIINISSVEGKLGKPAMGAYAAAKHAINGLTKSLAQEVGTMGVTANAICPGLVITDIVRDTGPDTAEAMGMTFDEMVAMFSAESAVKRPTTIDEVAALAVLLASPAGSGITGQNISVDGGTTPY